VAEEELGSPAHLLGGLVGEGDRQHLARPCPPCLHQPRQAMGEDAGLARACSGKHEERPALVGDRGLLRLVQAGEKGFGAGSGGGVGHSRPE